MLPKDFRAYLDYLEKNGKLLAVKKEVDVKHEIAAGIRKVADTDGPALLFGNIKGFPGWRMAGGLYATKKLMALALETEPDEQKLLQRYLDCYEKRIKPKLVSTGPVKEIIIKGDDIDLTKLPIPTYSEKDAGPYLIPAADIARHSETGIQNVTIDRRMVLGKNLTTLVGGPPKQMGIIITADEMKGQGTGVATVVGAPPELTLASQFRVPLGVDETEIAGAFRGEPLEVVKCETIDVEVPANAEIIIEGVTIPGERTIDGPFGDYRGSYVSDSTDTTGANAFVVKITAITMRKNPIFQAIACGMPMTEDHWLEKWALTAAAYRVLSELAPSREYIRGLSFTEVGPHCMVVSINKWGDRAGLDVIHTLLSHYLNIRIVIVVDDDIDVYDPSDVQWAWITRVSPEKDIILLRGGTHRGLATYRWGMDATVPIKDREWYAKAIPPGVDRVDYV